MYMTCFYRVCTYRNCTHKVCVHVHCTLYVVQSLFSTFYLSALNTFVHMIPDWKCVQGVSAHLLTMVPTIMYVQGLYICTLYIVQGVSVKMLTVLVTLPHVLHTSVSDIATSVATSVSDIATSCILAATVTVEQWLLNSDCCIQTGRANATGYRLQFKIVKQCVQMQQCSCAIQNSATMCANATVFLCNLK